MKRRILIAAALSAFTVGALSGGAFAWERGVRECGARCAQLAQQRSYDGESNDRRLRPFLRGPGANTYGGPTGDRLRALPPKVPGREPLPDGQIWAIAKSRVPGRIVNARLQGPIYSFRILSNRGSIVDVVVDRYSGRIVSVRGGP